MPVLSQIHCIRDSLFLSNRDPDLNLLFPILHQTNRNVSYAEAKSGGRKGNRLW
jgi:hypothetical protein